MHADIYIGSCGLSVAFGLPWHVWYFYCLLPDWCVLCAIIHFSGTYTPCASHSRSHCTISIVEGPWFSVPWPSLRGLSARHLCLILCFLPCSGLCDLGGWSLLVSCIFSNSQVIIMLNPFASWVLYLPKFIDGLVVAVPGFCHIMI